MNKGGPNTATKILFSLNQCQNVFDGKTEKKNDLYSICGSCGYCTKNYMPKKIRKDENKT